MVGANMAFYLTSLKLLLVSKSRLLAALSCPKFLPIHLTLSRPFTARRYKKLGWSLRSAADDNRLNSSSNESSGGTRLIRTIQVFQFKLTARLRELTKNLPVKLFSFLVGFYCATAFATVIGQTGDWSCFDCCCSGGYWGSYVQGLSSFGPQHKERNHHIQLLEGWTFTWLISGFIQVLTGTIYPKPNVKELENQC